MDVAEPPLFFGELRHSFAISADLFPMFRAIRLIFHQDHTIFSRQADQNVRFIKLLYRLKRLSAFDRHLAHFLQKVYGQRVQIRCRFIQPIQTPADHCILRQFTGCIVKKIIHWFVLRSAPALRAPAQCRRR